MRPTRSPDVSPLPDQEARDLVGAIVEIPKRERRVIGDHRQRGAVARRMQLIAPFFEQMVEPFARLPANRVVGVLANQHLSLTLASEWGPPSVGQGGLPEGGRAGLCAVAVRLVLGKAVVSSATPPPASADRLAGVT